MQTRRTLLATGTAVLASGLLPAQAAGLKPTRSMRGGSNNYRPGAPIVERIGGGGFWMSGTVRRAGDGAPLKGIRIQIWAHTTEGHERDWHSHGATLPELATSLGAAARKEADIAVGNAIGSNIFDLGAVLGITSLVSPVSVAPSVLLATSELLLTKSSDGCTSAVCRSAMKGPVFSVPPVANGTTATRRPIAIPSMSGRRTTPTWMFSKP